MPRASRTLIPGHIYHLTHRCHQREFLLKRNVDRDRLRQGMRTALNDHRVSLLTYNLTRNHCHWVLVGNSLPDISGFVQAVVGEFGRYYNRRKGRSGAFWDDRYHGTMLETGKALHDCLVYVELQMVRSGEVIHPRFWEWSGFQELMGLKKRNRLLDLDKVLELVGIPEIDLFRRDLDLAIERKIAHRELWREACWTESIAVGGSVFVQQLAGQIPYRRRLEQLEQDGHWVLRDECSMELESHVG